MATWITHLMIADKVLEKFPNLHRAEFCVGNIAPDCNVENEDWTQFTPSREVTHWMSADRKNAADCEKFYKEYIENRKYKIASKTELSFFLGYYSHLVTDAEFQRYIRDSQRVKNVWERIKRCPKLSGKASSMPHDWDSVKKLIPKSERMKDIYTIEAEYIEKHPSSGYLTEILPLKEFHDYIDYLPHGAITRKIKVMGYLPSIIESEYPFIAMTREEYSLFLHTATELVISGISRVFPT